MHLSLYPEIKSSLQMLTYMTYKSESFYGKHICFPFLIFLGKFSGAAMTEALTIYTLIRKTTILSVINGYIATYLIGKIGNVMAATLTHFDVDGIMSSKEIKYTRYTKFWDDVNVVKKYDKSGELNFIQWAGLIVILLLNRLTTIFYNVCYFYFIPMLVVVLSYMSDT
jgi:hypothetical protein